MTLACACCADPGQRDSYDIEFTDFERAQIAELAPAGPAKLFVTACDLDCVKGITAPQYAYQVQIAVTEAEVAIILADDGGAERGALSLPLPGRYGLFAVDTAPHEDARIETTLFTEMRLQGALVGRGDFAAATGAEAELVLSGFGNACLDITSMANWMLNARGEGVDFRLFGALGG